MDQVAEKELKGVVEPTSCQLLCRTARQVEHVGRGPLLLRRSHFRSFAVRDVMHDGEYERLRVAPHRRHVDLYGKCRAIFAAMNAFVSSRAPCGRTFHGRSRILGAGLKLHVGDHHRQQLPAAVAKAVAGALVDIEYLALLVAEEDGVARIVNQVANIALRSRNSSHRSATRCSTLAI